MSKTVTIRLNDDDYKQIASAAQQERRPISNFITHTVLDVLASINVVDDVEMQEILSDASLVKKLKRGHAQVATRKGKFVE